jgi:hypothetical protein
MCKWVWGGKEREKDRPSTTASVFYDHPKYFFVRSKTLRDKGKLSLAFEGWEV